jgi:hypothetical protein
VTTPLDPAGAASLAAAAGELIAPLAPAATPEPLPWVAAAQPARVEVDTTARYPLLLVTLLADLELDAVVVSPTLLSGGAAAAQPAARFAPWTQAGSAVVAAVPPVDDAGTAAPFRLECTATRITPDGAETPLVAATLRETVRVDLVQGLLGRLLAVILAEKPRLRRQARELRAMRTLAVAAGNALDRTGSDLRCPRFADELVWDPARRTPSTRPLSPPGALEDDVSYRARLQVLRGLRLPSPPWIDSVVNGPGPPEQPGTGWMAAVGLMDRIAIDESANALLLAFRLIAPGSPHGREQLLDAIRRIHLVWPAGSAAGDAAHLGRMVPPSVRHRTDATRVALASWSAPSDEPVAPSLAAALQVLDERCQRLGARPWPALLAGQRDAGGSRFELGLGGRLAAPDPARLDAAVAAAGGDPGLAPRPRDIDPAGAWLLTACGLRTVEQDSDHSVFISTVPMGPLVIDVEPSPDDPIPLTMAARLPTAADPSHDAPMAEVVATVAATGLVPEPAPAGVLAAMQPAQALPGLDVVLAAVGLPVVDQVAGFVARMGGISARDYAIFDLGPDRTRAARADPATLAELLDVAQRADASSAVAIVTGGGTLALILSVVGLPLAGSNLAARHTVFYRWEARGLAGTAAAVAPRRGPAVQVRGPGVGISLVSCLVHLREGANDPYEWRPALPPGSLLTLRQYEHLMNIVELVTPVGVRADTSAIRHQHVDVDGSGAPVPLPASAARTYRHYRTLR